MLCRKMKKGEDQKTRSKASAEKKRVYIGNGSTKIEDNNKSY